MVKSVFRYFLIASVLILIFGFGTKGFSYALTDAYNVLIGNGWTVKDALGFLGTSIAGTLAMNPSLAPAVAAGALSAYIVYKGAELYDIYREWRNLRTGIAILNPVEYSQSMAVKILSRGEYGWERLYVRLIKEGDNWFYWAIGYYEYLNNNGVKTSTTWSFGTYGRGTKNEVINKFNYYLANYVSQFQDGEGKAMFTAFLNTGYNYLVADTDYSVSYSRDVLVALDTGSSGVNASTLGYRVNVDPMSISEDGVNYLGDPDAFYQWFVNNYMSGSNEGTFVTPLDDAYDEIRTQLQSIIDQLNSLASTGGGVSEETLNQLKADILNTINTKVAGVETKLDGIDTKLAGVDSKLDGVDTKLAGVDSKLDGVDTKLAGVDSKLDGVDSTLTAVANNLNTLQTDITSLSNSIDTDFSTLQSDLASVKTSVDALTTAIDETQEQEQGFWEGLMTWLNETLWTKLRELLISLFVPEEAQLDELLNVDLPEYQSNFVADISFSSDSRTIPISLFGATVDLSGYIRQYASGLKTFMNIFVSGLAALFVIRAFRVHLNID